MSEYQKLIIHSKSKEFNFQNTSIQVNGKIIPMTEMKITHEISGGVSVVKLECKILSEFVETIIEG